MNERLYLQRRKAAPVANRAPRTALHDKLATPAPGQPLDSAARAALEPRFGHNFANVRIHADSEADQLAQEVEARAFTTGQHIYFSASTYDPASPGGLHLLAHELTHTIQQASGPVSGTERDGVAISDPGDSFERAADVTADRVFSGAAPPAMTGGGMASGGVAVQRDGDDDQLPHVYPSPSSPFNLHLLPGDPLGGGIGYGQPLAPVLPELGQDPRDIKPGAPEIPGMPSGGPNSGLWSRLGIGLQGRYGEDEKSIGAGLRLNF